MNDSARDTIILGLAIAAYGVLLWVARHTPPSLDPKRLEFGRSLRDQLISEEGIEVDPNGGS